MRAQWDHDLSELVGGSTACAKAAVIANRIETYVLRLESALRPFAEIAQLVDDPSMPDWETIVIDVEEPTGCAIAKLTWKDFRAARAALSKVSQQQDSDATGSPQEDRT